MQDLIERLEKATGPDRTLDRSIIGVLVDAGEVESHPLLVDVPPYTASLDAALTLVMPGHGWSLQGNTDVFYAVVYGQYNKPAAPTPALALCIAALRARLALSTSHEGARS